MDFDSFNFESYLTGLISGIVLACAVIGYYAGKLKAQARQAEIEAQNAETCHHARSARSRTPACHHARSAKNRLDY